MDKDGSCFLPLHHLDLGPQFSMTRVHEGGLGKMSRHTHGECYTSDIYKCDTSTFPASRGQNFILGFKLYHVWDLFSGEEQRYLNFGLSWLYFLSPILDEQFSSPPKHSLGLWGNRYQIWSIFRKDWLKETRITMDQNFFAGS